MKQRLTTLAVWAVGQAAAALAADLPPKPPPPAAAAAATPDPAAKTSDASAKASEAPAARAERLIRGLGDADYFARQQAQAELQKMGFDAFDALEKATTHEDLEIASRAHYLLRVLQVQWTIDTDPPEVKRHLRDYEFKDREGRIGKMKAIADLPAEAGLPALCRLVRFEQSPVLARAAATLILERIPAGQPPKASLAAALVKHLGGSARPPARWLLTYARFRDDPPAALAEWSRLVAAEEELLRRSPKETDPQIVSVLLRLELNWLERLKRADEALAVMSRLIDLEKGDPASLAQLVRWLIDQKAWELIDQVYARFTARFQADRGLLYVHAEVKRARGDAAAADALAEQARKKGTQTQQGLSERFLQATVLQQRGLFDWAEAEYREVVAHGVPGRGAVLPALVALGEMLHDQGQNQKAAETYAEALKAAGGRQPEEDVAGRTPAQIRARMHFFQALHHREKGDAAAHRKSLDDALAADSADVDVLIACYRLGDADAEYRRRIVDLIRRAASELRNEISQSDDDPSPCNQFAWLVGNTEGDFDEALRYSKNSIELSPDTGGYYDTLARVYFAKGDLAAAVEYQRRAVELEPHSGLIRRQLETFQKAHEDAAGKPAPDDAKAGK